MRVIICFLGILCSFSTFALTPKALNCSRSGTEIVFVNGISYSRKDVKDILHNEIKPSIPTSYLDSKAPAGSFVTFTYSYNHTNGFLKDLLESSVQKISQNFNVSPNEAFIAAYYFTYKGALTVNFISSIFTTKTVSFGSVFNYLTSYFSPNTLDKMVQDSITQNVSDNSNLKTSISSTLLSGNKLIIISESQGNFFVNSVIRDFQNGQLLNNGAKTGRYEDFKDYVGQVQISPPTRSIIDKNRVVLNDKDVINLVFFDRPESTFNYFEVPAIDPRGIDHYLNHMITSTYLNDYDVGTGSLPGLKDFTLQSVVNVASLLESNCPKAVINYTKSNLQVNFNSTDPQNSSATGLTYSWNFGDGQLTNTAFKTLSHNYAQAGTYNVSLTVTDSFGASAEATASVVLAGDTAIYTFCNSGQQDRTGASLEMDFIVDGKISFSLHHDARDPFSNQPNICECKQLELSKKTNFVNVTINGQWPRYIYFSYQSNIDGKYPLLYGAVGTEPYLVINPGNLYQQFNCSQLIYK
ncbi:MAG: PKD domain-containing protein [Bacteriovorax sp.]|nr:PKD domain-containing protein [Bacteriovorax sp.]